MISILPLEKEDAAHIVEWNRDTTDDFLTQWAGPKSFNFPITEAQIISRIEKEPISDYRLYKILADNNMIGTIELLCINVQEKTAKIGRFLINPLYVGKGYGTTALVKFCNMAFNEFGFHNLELNVFDFNKSAIRCYEKAGFKLTKEVTYPNGWKAKNMIITNPIN